MNTNNTVKPVDPAAQAQAASVAAPIAPNPAPTRTGMFEAAATGAPSGTSASGKNDLSNMFTTLLVAQIKNQNPLEPSDPSEFVKQLTQLSQTEALQKLSGQGSGNAGMLESLQQLTLGAQVGSTVQAKVDAVNLGDKAISTRFNLESPAGSASLVLTGSDGHEQRVALGAVRQGPNAFELDPKTLGLAPGHYGARIETDAKEQVGLEISAPLTSVRVAPGGSSVLSLGGVADVAPSALTQFNGRTAATH
jgi:flagellar basal-body rod modification protein FlgD